MTTETPCPEDHPLMIAWKAHQETDEFTNSKKWAAHPEHLQGSLWALFMAGFFAGVAQGRREGAEEAAEECDGAAEAHERATLNSTAKQKRYHRDAAHEIRIVAKAIRSLPTTPEDARDSALAGEKSGG